MRGWVIILLANFFNVLDLITTLWGINHGFREVNVAANALIHKSVILYAVFKLSGVLIPSLLYLVLRHRDDPISQGISRGCLTGLCLMVAIIGTASTLNVLQILFKVNVKPALQILSKIIPTLKI